MNKRVNKRKLLSIGIVIALLAVDVLVISFVINGENRSYGHTLDDFNAIVKETGALPADNIYNPGMGNYITVYGKVIEKLAPDLNPPRHEQFMITVNGSKEVKVVYNVDYNGRGWLNVEVGDWVVFTGEVFIYGNGLYGIHKIAEDGGFLILFRPSNGMMIEIGYYPPTDNIYLAVLAIVNIGVLVALKFSNKIISVFVKK